MMKNRSSYSGTGTPCSHSGLCYDLLINQCAPCVDRTKHSTSDNPCSHSGLCYDRLIKQCLPCVDRTGHSSSDSTCSHSGLCYDHLIRQCLPCVDRSRQAGSSTDITCHRPGLCYDRLIEQCVSCEKMHRSTEKETTTALQVTSTITQVPASVTAADQTCPPLLFGIYVFVGLVLAMVAMLCVVFLKQKRRKRMREAEKEDSKENEKCIISFENEPQRGHDCSPGDDDPGLLKCPHSNGTSNPARDDILSRSMQYIPMEESDTTEAVSLTSCDKKCNPTFPLPATELGATVLVTTKTTQVHFISEESS